mmetsp:Transcript_23527/g.75912  ORF Transcript_23527/g.75912 Transcript_23527/m.75912 type:complete len:278 (-) Transcript_23527:1433-2266(-)
MQRRQVEVAIVGAAEADGARERVVVTKQQVHKSRLAAAAPADQRADRAGRDGERDALEHGVAGPHLVAEGNLRDLDRPVAERGDALAARRRDVGLKVDEGEDALGGAGGARERVEQPVERLPRRVDHVPVQLVLDERSDCDGASAHGDGAAVPEDEYARAEVEVVVEHGRERAEARVADPLGERRRQVPRHTRRLRRLRREGAHSPHVGDGLVGRRHRVRVVLVDLAVDPARPLCVRLGHVHDRQHRGVCNHRELPRGDEAHDDAADEEQRVGDEHR